MATKKNSTQSSAQRKAQAEIENGLKKIFKKHPIVGAIVSFILVLAMLGTFTFCGYQGYLNGWFGDNNSDKPDDGGVVVEGEVSIHFLMLGNEYAGDCTYIKAGDNDILIDAGSRQSSAKTIIEYVDNYCTDGTLEYVIATHADQDHIAAFNSTKSQKGIFDYYECETIIDFPLTDKTTATYRNYVTYRDKEVVLGAKHYTALECYNNENGASRVIDLGGGLEMEILYQRYYEERDNDENNYSVCFMINQGDSHYLFTGDLEKEGEESLVESNDLPKCKLFKGGHHGSRTSTNDCLLEKIQPEIVCVCCCAGSYEYTQYKDSTFPTQDFISRVSKYTEKIYVTTLSINEYNSTDKEWETIGFEPMNGNIVVTGKDGEVSVKCSHSDVILKDTEWFKNNRVWG